MMSTNQSRELASLEQITPHIFRFIGQRFYGEAVGTYLIRDDKEAVIIDVPSYNPRNLEAVTSLGLPVRIYLTHASTGPDGDRWQSSNVADVHMHEGDVGHPWLACAPKHLFTGDFQITKHLRAIHLPGHSPGHMAFYDDRDGGSLFTGDGILLHGKKFELEVTRDAAAKVLGLTFERMLPFHYNMILTGAQTTVVEALRGL